MLITVFIPAGTTTPVARAGVEDVEAGAAAVEVGEEAVERGAAVTDELDWPTTVTSTVIVYSIPVLADSTVNTTGRVNPISPGGGSKVTWFGRVAEMVANVALLATIVSAAFCRYADKDNTVFVLAGIVIAVTAGEAALVGTARDDVAEAELDGPTTVTRTVTVYVMPVAAD